MTFYPRVFSKLTYTVHSCRNMVIRWKSLHFTNAKKKKKIYKSKTMNTTTKMAFVNSFVENLKKILDIPS